MFIIFLLLFCGIAKADVYVLTAPDKSVYSLSEQDDAIVPDGYKKDIVKGKKIQDLPIVNSEKLYDFNKGTFTLNSTRVKEKNKIEEDAIIREQKITSNRESGLKKIKELGLTDDEITALFK